MRLLMLLSMAAGFAFGTSLTSVAATREELYLSWRLIGNKPEGGFQAELHIKNFSNEPFAGGWTIYFNSASRLLPESLPAAYKLTHINGDFYSLRPTQTYTPIPAGKTDSIAYKGSPWALNVSDAPSGFYLVREGQSESSASPKVLPLEIERFPNADKLRRGANDAVPVVTAEARFKENELLKLLPAESLTKVVPTPCSVQSIPGILTLNKSSLVLYDANLESEATQLLDSIAPLLGARIASRKRDRDVRPSPHTIILRIGTLKVGNEVKRPGDEAYQLSASAERGIEITGSDAAGVFYGIQTLRALLPIDAYREAMDQLEMEALQITDAPRFRYRGVHLDVARNFQSKEAVKKLLDIMAFYKLNWLHWHLTDDEGWRIEIRQLPELTTVGGRRGHTLDEQKCLVPSHGSGPDPKATTSAGNGYYSQSDIEEIVRYANSRHIDIIPEIDLPGHARAAIKAMEARGQRLAKSDVGAPEDLQLRAADDPSRYESVQLWNDNVVDVGRDEIYRFLSIVVDELAAIYERAGRPLTSIHLGGDEVPDGAWDGSAACAVLALEESSTLSRHEQLQLFFLDRASELLSQSSIQPACWEDCLLLEMERHANSGNDRRATNRPTPVAYVWNIVWGWGREDAAYRLANAGFDVVLCNATHLYLDLAYEKDPLEPGYYWAGFVDARKPFEFVPLDIFKNADQNSMGQPVGAESLVNRTSLTDEGQRHILGIQGQLWGENLRDIESLEYMAFPRLIVLAERAWAASPPWANLQNAEDRAAQLETDWNQFANRLGQRELPRLDWLFGGVRYRLPPPGAMIHDGLLYANVAYPGIEIHYTNDGTEPHTKSPRYRKPIREVTNIRLSSFNSRGRGSRSLTITDQSRD